MRTTFLFWCRNLQLLRAHLYGIFFRATVVRTTSPSIERHAKKKSLDFHAPLDHASLPLQFLVPSGLPALSPLLDNFYWWFGMIVCSRWWLIIVSSVKLEKHRVRLCAGPSSLYLFHLNQACHREAEPTLYCSPIASAVVPTCVTCFMTISHLKARQTCQLTNEFPLWGCPKASSSPDGLSFCSQLPMIIYQLFCVRKVATSAYHLTVFVALNMSHTIAQMFSMVGNGKQTTRRL